jgi:thiol:disulfide interchange protein DsbD
MVDAGTVEIQYAIASGYYMYRERFDFRSPDVKLGAPFIPSGKVKFDETFAKNVETYRGILKIRMPVQASGEFKIIATAQGCADSGLCYSPMESVAQLSTAMVPAGAHTPGPSAGDQEAGAIQASLNSGNLVSILPLFLLLGLGLAFTPCVLPMVPILSSIIVGDKHAASRGRGLLLSGAYALGMSMVYILLGVAAGLAGEGLVAAFQNPWVLGTFGLLMVGLSLSMFGLFQLQMPAVIQSRLMQASHLQAGGKVGGVFVMGALSALIVGPCVAAPLAGVLLYISHTRDMWVGASALFAMAVGMSVPLLLVGGRRCAAAAGRRLDGVSQALLRGPDAGKRTVDRVAGDSLGVANGGMVRIGIRLCRLVIFSCPWWLAGEGGCARVRGRGPGSAGGPGHGFARSAGAFVVSGSNTCSRDAIQTGEIDGRA